MKRYDVAAYIWPSYHYSWNEWTEGSYLLPDMRWGYGYLQAIRNVFCKTLSSHKDDRGPKTIP